MKLILRTDQGDGYYQRTFVVRNDDTGDVGTVQVNYNRDGKRYSEQRSTHAHPDSPLAGSGAVLNNHCDFLDGPCACSFSFTANATDAERWREAALMAGV